MVLIRDLTQDLYVWGLLEIRTVAQQRTYGRERSAAQQPLHNNPAADDDKRDESACYSQVRSKAGSSSWCRFHLLEAQGGLRGQPYSLMCGLCEGQSRSRRSGIKMDAHECKRFAALFCRTLLEA